MAALLGPPELNSQDQSSDPFVNLMSHSFENADKPSESPVNVVAPSYPFMGYAGSSSFTYLSSGDSCLDFFFTVVPDTPADTVVNRLNLAWAHDPLVALKLICNLRAVRGTGKSYKEGFFTAALWLFNHHPKTLAANVKSFADLGCFKDLPEILYRLLEGPDVRQQQKESWEMIKSGGRRRRQLYLRQPDYDYESRKQKRKRQKKKKKRSKPKVPRNVRVEIALARAKVEKQNARILRRDKKMAMAKKLLTRYSRDSNFKNLYESVSGHFADCLKSDLQYLKAREFRKLSLASKWCPSLDSSFDKSTLLCESVARKVFDRESHPEYQGIEEAHYAYRVRDRLRKEVLVPLRKALKLPEIFISAKKWHLVPYERVGSVAMAMYKQMFFRRDNKRFLTHLEEAKNGEISTTRRSGFIGQRKPKKKQPAGEKVEDNTKTKKSTPKPRKSTIAAGALLPHEIISAVFDQNKSDDCGQVAEAQWKRMVDDLMKKGKLRNCMAICDVSGNMDGTPLEVAVAMGLLVSELSDAPWRGKLITFSSSPQFQQVQGSCLRSKVMSVRDAGWRAGAEIGKVFDIILKVAVEGKLKPEQMIKRLFIFSGMNFESEHSNSGGYYGSSRQMDRGSMRGWETDYKAIVKKFMDKGYGDAVPELVFWNLKETKTTVVTRYDKGVALVSGFSKNLLRIFLDHQGDLNPQAIMEAALSGKEYDKLVVLD